MPDLVTDDRPRVVVGVEDVEDLAGLHLAPGDLACVTVPGKEANPIGTVRVPVVGERRSGHCPLQICPLIVGGHPSVDHRFGLLHRGRTTDVYQVEFPNPLNDQATSPLGTTGRRCAYSLPLDSPVLIGSPLRTSACVRTQTMNSTSISCEPREKRGIHRYPRIRRGYSQTSSSGVSLLSW